MVGLSLMSIIPFLDVVLGNLCEFLAAIFDPPLINDAEGVVECEYAAYDPGHHHGKPVLLHN